MRAGPGQLEHAGEGRLVDAEWAPRPHRRRAGACLDGRVAHVAPVPCRVDRLAVVRCVFVIPRPLLLASTGQGSRRSRGPTPPPRTQRVEQVSGGSRPRDDLAEPLDPEVEAAHLGAVRERVLGDPGRRLDLPKAPFGRRPDEERTDVVGLRLRVLDRDLGQDLGRARVPLPQEGQRRGRRRAPPATPTTRPGGGRRRTGRRRATAAISSRRCTSRISASRSAGWPGRLAAGRADGRRDAGADRPGRPGGGARAGVVPAAARRRRGSGRPAS